MTDAIVEAAEKHIPFIVQAARQADINECWDYGAVTIREALLMSLTRAEYARTWMVNGQPAAIGGVNPPGVVWLLGTSLIDMYPRRFLVRSVAELEKAQKRYDHLFNCVSAQNTRYQEWLIWMGFQLYPPEPRGIFKRLFYFFEWRRNDSTD